MNPSGDSGYTTHLSSRYNSGCSYVNYIVNVYQNYHLIKVNTMNTETNSINSIQTNFNNYDSEVSTLKSNLGTFSTNLAANFDFITNL
jgi:hypothetical protein